MSTALPTSILATDYELPDEVLTFEQLSERFGAEAAQKVFAGSGIRSRRVAPPNICGSDLAYAAADRLLQRCALDRSTIDLLIFCTQSADYLMPTTACVLHERLQLAKRCAAFDINLGCSQYVYALSVAHGMIASGSASRALVLTGDTMTRTVHPMDRSLVPLMGDGGSASLIGQVGEGEGFLGFELGTDGTGHRYLMIPAGGFRQPVSSETRVEVADNEGNIRCLSFRNLCCAADDRTASHPALIAHGGGGSVSIPPSEPLHARLLVPQAKNPIRKNACVP
jgi:3-oxoacyl-[acyl-carrier-protein] synthase-3